MEAKNKKVHVKFTIDHEVKIKLDLLHAQIQQIENKTLTIPAFVEYIINKQLLAINNIESKK